MDSTRSSLPLRYQRLLLKNTTSPSLLSQMAATQSMLVKGSKRRNFWPAVSVIVGCVEGALLAKQSQIVSVIVLGLVHTYPDVFENAVLCWRPPRDSVFGPRKRSFSKTLSRVDLLKTLFPVLVWTGENVAFRKS